MLAIQHGWAIIQIEVQARRNMKVSIRSRNRNPGALTPPGSNDPVPYQHGLIIAALRIWDDPWQLDRRVMTWRRQEHYYHSNNSALELPVRSEQTHTGPSVRPGPLRNVGFLDVPLAVLRSHPDTPNVLPEKHEGMWISTNPAWPERTVDEVLRKFGLRAVWEDSSKDLTETYELAPTIVGEVTAENSEPFDETPLVLSALVVYAKRQVLETVRL